MILDRFRLDDRVAIVTGAGRGIGRGIALAFAEVGADVVVAARTQEQIDDTAHEIEQRGQQAAPVRCDVTKRPDLENVVATAIDRFGKVDILVNNAGGWMPREAMRTSEKSFDDAFHFNVTTAFLLTRLTVPKMVETAGTGAVVNIASRAGSMVQKGFAAYGTAKAGLIFLTRLLAAEFAPKVRVNAIGVGGVNTSALEVVMTNDAIREEYLSKTPMGRIGEVEDIAACALYLASDAGSWVTGKIMEVDGGSEWPALEIPVTPL